MNKLMPLLIVLTAVFVNYAMAQEQAVEVLAQPKPDEAEAFELPPLSIEEQQLKQDQAAEKLKAQPKPDEAEAFELPPLSVEEQQLKQDQAAEKLKAQQQHLNTLVLFCAPCHGVNGISAIDIYPNLAGQQQEYLAKQLRDFKSKARVDVVMNGLVKRLNQDDIQMLAEYYASLVVEQFDDKAAEPSDATELPVTNDDIPVETGEQHEG
jgi:cytochrome c553